MIGVRTEHPGYRVAVAELPSSTRLVDEPHGAIVVLGAGAEAVAAAEPDAVPAAFVIADPTGAFDLTPRPGIPLVVDRARLHPDVVVDAGVHPDAALFTAECAAPAADIAATVRDAIGWLRVLSGERLELDAVHATGHGAIALLRAGERAATLSATLLAEPSAGVRLRALAIGVERVEVTIDAAGAASVVRASDAGSLTKPARYESRRRAALRRAIDAIDSGDPGDLDVWRHDEALAVAILPIINGVYYSHRQNPLP